MDKETLEMLDCGEDILFTFKNEAIAFAQRTKLTIEYKEGDLIDNEHFNVKGYKGKIYWIAN